MCARHSACQQMHISLQLSFQQTATMLAYLNRGVGRLRSSVGNIIVESGHNCAAAIRRAVRRTSHIDICKMPNTLDIWSQTNCLHGIWCRMNAAFGTITIACCMLPGIQACAVGVKVAIQSMEQCIGSRTIAPKVSARSHDGVWTDPKKQLHIIQYLLNRSALQLTLS